MTDHAKLRELAETILPDACAPSWTQMAVDPRTVLALLDEIAMLRSQSYCDTQCINREQDIQVLIATQQRLQNTEKRVAELEDVLRQTHANYCTEAWTDRGLHAPECLLHEIERQVPPVPSDPC